MRAADQLRHGGALAAVLGSLVAPPAHGFEAEPALPQTRASGPITVTFTHFQRGLSPRDLRRAARPGEKAWLRADFRIETKGKLTRSWLPERIGIRDRSGKAWTVESTRVFYGPDGEGCFAFPPPPGTHPYPWQLTVELARATRFMPYELWGDFSRDELWTVPLVPVPGANETTRGPALRRGAVRLGVGLELAEAAGSRIPVHGMRARSGVTRLTVRMGRAPSGTELTLVRAVDFKGRLAPVVASSVWERPLGCDRVFGVQTRPDARTLNVTFAVHRSRTVSFTAVPTPPAAPVSDGE